MLQKEALENVLQDIRRFIQHAPAAMALLTGPDHVFQLVNHEYVKVTGRLEPALIGRPVRDALPEVASQGFIELLDRVYRTGQPVAMTETMCRLDRGSNGKLEDSYFNFVYEPWKDASGGTAGILVHAVDISEQVFARQRLEQVIREHKRAERDSLLLGAIVDSSDDAIVSKNLDGIIMSWNKGAERVFGYTAGEVVGKSITIIIPEDRLSEEVDILSRLRRGERIAHFETIRRRKDGSLLNISVTISPVKDAQGNIIGASKIARDITDRKRAEEAIRDLNVQLTADLYAMTRMQRLSTQLVQAGEFSLLLEQIVDAGIEITGADMGNIQLFEDGVLKIAAQRGFKRSFLNFFKGAHAGVGAYGAALENAQRVIVEDVTASPLFENTPALNVMLESGAYAVQSTPLVSRSGQLLGTFSTHYRSPRRPGERELRMLDLLARQAADLIERMRIQEALRDSETRFRELAEAGPQFIWVSRPDGSIEYVNERWTAYSGLASTAFATSALLAPAFHSEDYPELVSRWQHSLESGETLEVEARLRRKDGAYRWFVIRAIPIKDSHGRILKWVGSATDIEEQKRVQEELRRVNQDLEQFAYSASHDLQEPLRSVKIYSQLLSERYGGQLQGEALEFLQYLRDGATRMELLIRDLLAYTQVTQSDAPPGNADANEALKDALANLKPAIADSGAKIRFDSLPAVRVQSTHLKQLFQNLVGNALKYRSPDRVPEVQGGAERRDGYWIFYVKDNGIGIAPAYKERIFGLFKRLHTAETYSGTGIGLAICQRIVERYHGRIWVESEPGHGSVFLFTIPD